MPVHSAHPDLKPADVVGVVMVVGVVVMVVWPVALRLLVVPVSRSMSGSSTRIVV